MWELVAVVLLSVGLGAAVAYYLFGAVQLAPVVANPPPDIIRVPGEPVLIPKIEFVEKPFEAPETAEALRVLTKRVEAFKVAPPAPPTDLSSIHAVLAELKSLLVVQAHGFDRLVTAVDAIPNPQPVNPVIPGAGPQSWKVAFLDTRDHVVAQEARRDRRPATITRENGIIYAAGQQRADGTWEYRQVR